ncbi:MULTISPECIES: hypothetical protein [Clostridium]|uniref:hypothetical protein n=1 Tax=Clostridium TaxID=1485 RepID=UPI0008265EC7|nr:MULTISPECIES: hypothetical protein [Clostridium]PJI06819.1 hypothetical protein CUB90_02555 [Clostridium sp. CT7]
MYIKLSTLGFICLGMLIAVALIYLIILIHKLSQTVSKVNLIIDKNEKNISEVIDSLPEICENISDIGENARLVTEVVTEATASAVEAKNNISEYLVIIKDIIGMIRAIFKKDK